MTSVVGILNKRGIAIAADSAVTRSRSKSYGGKKQKITKYTNNGNKMVRLSNAVPVTVMFTGNLEFLGIPWDVIARRYRQKRGDVAHPTVESAVVDFFNFISENPVFWDHQAVSNYIESVLKDSFDEIVGRMRGEAEKDASGALTHPAQFKESFIKRCRDSKIFPVFMGCPQYVGYTIDTFRARAEAVMDMFFFNKAVEGYPEDMLRELRPHFEENILAIISSRHEDKASSELIFSGFGADQEYPSLVSVCVFGGYDSRVNYHYDDEDVVNISDERPVAICPFAQTDVINSILRGVHYRWANDVMEPLRRLIQYDRYEIFDLLSSFKHDGFLEKLKDVGVQDLYERFDGGWAEMCETTQKEWEKSLMEYDLEEMAALADSLISLTGFHRILTFSNEGVGGPVDLAVMSKADGFIWLRRKNWYHRDSGLGI